jgi:hypothetical protein
MPFQGLCATVIWTNYGRCRKGHVFNIPPGNVIPGGPLKQVSRGLEAKATIRGNFQVVLQSLCTATVAAVASFNDTNLDIEEGPEPTCAANVRAVSSFNDVNLETITQCRADARAVSVFQSASLQRQQLACVATVRGVANFLTGPLRFFVVGECQAFIEAESKFNDSELVQELTCVTQVASEARFNNADFNALNENFCNSFVNVVTVFNDLILDTTTEPICSPNVQAVSLFGDSLLEATGEPHCTANLRAVAIFSAELTSAGEFCTAEVHGEATFLNAPLAFPRPEPTCEALVQAVSIFRTGPLVSGFEQCTADIQAEAVFRTGPLGVQEEDLLIARRTDTMRWVQDTVSGQRFRIRVERTGGSQVLRTVPHGSAMAVVFRPGLSSLLPASNRFLILQGQKSAIDLTPWNIRKDCWVMHGSALKAGTGTTEQQFFDATQGEIEDDIRTYLGARPDLGGEDTTDFVVLDIEIPFHPREFDQYLFEDAAKFRGQILAGFRRRIEAARTVLRGARIGLYFTFGGPLSGNANETRWSDQKEAWTEAVRRGLLDKVNFLVPNFYINYGPTDERYLIFDETMRLGIEWMRTLRRTNGTAFALFCMSTFRNQNESSEWNDMLTLNSNYDAPGLVNTNALYKSVMEQRRVEYYSWWDGGDQLTAPNPENLTKSDYFNVLFPAGP